MAAGGACLLAFAVISVLVMSSLGDPMPLCSDCETMCRTNCTVEAEANCANYCNGTEATSRDCKGCTGGYFGQYCSPKCLNNCSNICKKEPKVHRPRSLCIDCDTLCTTNCADELETSCSESCQHSPLADCRAEIFKWCTEGDNCCSSYGTCTCDCNTEAQKCCEGVSDNYTNCEICKRAKFDQDCYPTCNNECKNNCKKKGCPGHA